MIVGRLSYQLSCGHIICTDGHKPLFQHVFISKGYCKELLDLGALKQLIFILSQFWKPEIRNQGAGRVGFFCFWDLCSMLLSQILVGAGNPWLIGILLHSLPLSPHDILPCMSMSLCPNVPLLIRTPILLDLGLTLL